MKNDDSGIGVVLDSFRLPVKEALQSAANLGLREVELSAATDEVDPAGLSRTGRRHLSRYVLDLGLRLSALGGDLGGTRFNDGAKLEQRLNRTRRIIELAAELHVPIVTTHLGRVDDEALRRGYVRQAIEYLAEVADRASIRVAFETGSADPQVVADLLGEVDCRELAACYDPASLLIDGLDPLAGVEPLADRIVIARARDAVAGAPGRPGHETPLGDGQLDLAEYLAALDQAGYRGVAFIRRTDAERPREEIADAKARIERLLRR